MNSTTLILSIFFGAFGFGYIVYGRKQQKGIPLLVGVALCAFPFFVSNVVLAIVIGAILIFLPWFIKS
jgi:hypothetical protein